MSDDTEDISLNFGEENETSRRKNVRWVDLPGDADNNHWARSQRPD